MRKFLVFLVVILVLGFPLISQGENHAVHQKPAIYAVMMHADWCGTCKALAPKIAQARENDGLDSKDVLFIKLDLTDDTSKHQAAMMAAILGIEDVYESNAGNTGFMLLINAETGEKISQITNKLDSKKISALITKTIDSTVS